MDKTLVRYPVDLFMSYKNANNIMEKLLEEHCLNNNNVNLDLRDQFLKEIEEVVGSIMSGVDPNEIAFKNTIRELLNKINRHNYPEYILKLSEIHFVSEDNFKTVASELLIRAMNDTIASKGFADDDSHTISDVNSDAISDLNELFIENNGNPIYFRNIFKNMCQLYFEDFIDPNKALDENNQHRVDNFKGFMNFIGLLFRKNIMSSDIVMSCLKNIVDLIKNPKLTPEEVSNVFNAYERLLNQLILFCEKNKNKQDDLIESILTINRSVIQGQNKLKKFNLLTHEKLTERINLLQTN